MAVRVGLCSPDQLPYTTIAVYSCWGSHRNVYQHLRWGVTHKENMEFRLTPESYFKSHGWLYAHILPCKHQNTQN